MITELKKKKQQNNLEQMKKIEQTLKKSYLQIPGNRKKYLQLLFSTQQLQTKRKELLNKMDQVDENVQKIVRSGL